MFGRPVPQRRPRRQIFLIRSHPEVVIVPEPYEGLPSEVEHGAVCATEILQDGISRIGPEDGAGHANDGIAEVPVLTVTMRTAQKNNRKGRLDEILHGRFSHRVGASEQLPTRQQCHADAGFGRLWLCSPP